MISPERLYLTSDRSAVVKHGDPRASFLLVGAGCELDDATAKRYGLDKDIVPAEVDAEASSEATPEVADPPKDEDAPESPPAPSPATSKTPAFKAVPTK